MRFDGLRSTKGMVRACLTRNPHYFPRCNNDPEAYKESVAAAPGATMRFSGVAPGDYAITVLHDENRNFKPDFMLGIPREGVGFSRNPVLRMGPPSFAAARFAVPAAPVAQEIRIKYFL